MLPLVGSFFFAGLIADIRFLGKKRILIITNILIFLVGVAIYANLGESFIIWFSIQNFVLNVNAAILFEYTAELYPTSFRSTGYKNFNFIKFTYIN